MQIVCLPAQQSEKQVVHDQLRHSAAKICCVGATGGREAAATAFELWIEAVRNRAMPVATAARLL